MIIKISNLSDGVHNFSFDEPVENLELGLPFIDKIQVNVELSKTLNQIILDCDLKSKALVECDRCGNNFEAVLESSYRMVYLFENEPEENESLDMTYLPIDADKIDLTADVRDYSVLAIPMKKLCKEDCKGLCFRCGKDLNEGKCDCEEKDIDPRWQPLQELKNKLNIN